LSIQQNGARLTTRYFERKKDCFLSTASLYRSTL
jgi:hypothetical protein